MFQFPMLKADGLKGAVVYYDGMHNDTRMNVLIALTAAQHGASVANYVEVRPAVLVITCWLCHVAYASHECRCNQSFTTRKEKLRVLS